jgi:hypothetical protein
MRLAVRVSMKTLLDVPKMRVGSRVTWWLPLSANKAVREVVRVVTGLEG